MNEYDYEELTNLYHEGHLKHCSECGRVCDSLSTDGGDWPILMYDSTGTKTWAHISCLSIKIKKTLEEKQLKVKGDTSNRTWAPMEDKLRGLATQIMNITRNYIMGEISSGVYVANINTLNFSLHEEMEK